MTRRLTKINVSVSLPVVVETETPNHFTASTWVGIRIGNRTHAYRTELLSRNSKTAADSVRRLRRWVKGFIEGSAQDVLSGRHQGIESNPKRRK